MQTPGTKIRPPTYGRWSASDLVVAGSGGGDGGGGVGARGTSVSRLSCRISSTFHRDLCTEMGRAFSGGSYPGLTNEMVEAKVNRRVRVCRLSIIFPFGCLPLVML